MYFKKALLFLFIVATSVSFGQEEKINQLDAKGNRHGLWKGVHEKSQRPRYEGTFINGKETGVFKYFDDTKTGTVIATRDFSKGDGSCYVIMYNQKSNKVSEGLLNKNKENEGVWKYYHQNSPQPMSVETFKNGKLNGKSVVYYKNGKIASETHYKDGIKDGLYKKYSQDGIVLEEIPYKNNQFNGMVTYRDVKGQIIAQGMYEKGLKKGIWKFYENGKLIREVNSESKEFIYKG